MYVPSFSDSSVAITVNVYVPFASLLNSIGLVQGENCLSNVVPGPSRLHSTLSTPTLSVTVNFILMSFELVVLRKT